jgi:hypothetical protein
MRSLEQRVLRNVRGRRFRARVLTWGLFAGAAAAVLAPVGPGAFVPLKMAIAAADSVGNDVYVAVVVDFGNGSTISKCVPVPSTARDSDALAAAVGQSNVAYSSSGLLCAIDNYPVNGVQNCGQSVGSGNYDYWSYWHGSSGAWVYASNGPAEQSVSSPGNDVEGWRFQTDEPDTPSDPPPTPSASYAQICNASTEVPPPGSQPSPPVTATTSSPQPEVTTTTTVGSPTATNQTTGTQPRTQGPQGATTGKAGAGTTTTSRTGAAHGGAGGGTHPTSSPHATALAGSPSHRESPGGGGPSILPVILVVLVVAGLGGVAFYRWRRRPAEE